MFTGIIKELGSVEKISKNSALTKIGVKTKAVFEQANVSDSISIDGVCLTVTDKKNDILFFDAVKSTIEKTNLKRIKLRDFVNLEPALKMGGSLGGHFVLGHVDCEAKVKRIIKKNNYWQLEVNFPVNFRKYVTDNGSVSLNGISLTVKKVTPRFFTVDIIPFTYENTNLKYKRVGDWINVEFDYLLKRR
ncbi:MAG: riboflavin synthase [Candidatus Omnitrophica bacterium]|jgi:riboflavin synthase|nr:riboflavin synthase [Candidatus Omnitrophota bacterium]